MKEKKDIKKVIKELKEKYLKNWEHNKFLLFYKYVKVWVK